MTALALRTDASATANDNIAGSLPAMVRRAASHLTSATTAAEVLEAKAEAGLAYTAAKAASRMARAKGAYDELMSAIFRAQADALEIEAQAKRRLADEFDREQAAGNVGQSGIRTDLVMEADEVVLSVSDIFGNREALREARQIRDAENDNPGIIKATLDALVEAGKEPTKAALKRGISGRLASYSGDNEWYTPAKYVEMARTVMGRIDVDPASNDHAQQTVKARTYYTAETNGLDKDWRGTVWMNPPYSHPEIQHFTDKMLAELASGNATEAIVLTNNSGDTGWHHALALASAARCVTRGRIRFESLTRQSGAGAMGQVFFYFGDDVERFADVFSEIGRIEVNYTGGNNGKKHIRRTACDTVTLDTPSVAASDLTTDPYAAQGVRLARENPIRRATAFANGDPNEYFEWRQAIGNSYYEEQERLAGRVAANDNHPANHRRAA